MKIKSLHLLINYLRRLTLPLCVLCALAISACAGSPKVPAAPEASVTPTVSVTLMPNSDQRLESGKTLPISATLANDRQRKGVTWTLAGAGALIAQTTTSVMYQAPANITAQEIVTVTATPLAGGRESTSLKIVLVPQKTADTIHTDNPD
jgi:hypothetical protein